MKFKDIIGILAICSLLALLVLPAAAANTVTVANTTGTDNATRLYNEGVTLLSANDYPAALDRFNAALRENTTIIASSDTLLYVYQGKAYTQIQLGKYADALQTTQAGLALFPRDAKLWNNQGFAFYNLGRYQDALTGYDKAIGIDGNYTIALVNEGGVLYKMGRYQDAVDAYTRALATDPGNVDATDGLKHAQQAAGTALPIVPILIIVVILVVIGAAWYVKSKKPAEQKPDAKKGKDKKEKK